MILKRINHGKKIHIVLGMIFTVAIKAEVVAKMTGIYGT